MASTATDWAAMPYVAEFFGTLLFLSVILFTVVTWAGPPVLIAALIGFGLFAGIYLSGLLGGPGYLNPAVALMLGVQQNRSAMWTSGMILAELFAVIVAVAVIFGLSLFAKKSATTWCWIPGKC